MAWTVDSACAALAECERDNEQTLMRQISAETGWPIIEDCLVPDPGIWHATDGYGPEVAEAHESGESAAQSYVDGGGWEDIGSGLTIDVRAWREGIDHEGDIVRVDEDVHAITILPDEPDCEESEDGEHDWRSPHAIVGGCRENPGVWSTGGTSYRYLDVCRHCGMFRERTASGWQRNPGDAEETVEYLPATEESRAWVEVTR